MIVERIRYPLAEYFVREFLDAYARAAVALRRASNCHRVRGGAAHPGRGLRRRPLRVLSIDARLIGFRPSVIFPPFLDEVRTFIAGIAETRQYGVFDAVWSRADGGAAG